MPVPNAGTAHDQFYPALDVLEARAYLRPFVRISRDRKHVSHLNIAASRVMQRADRSTLQHSEKFVENSKQKRESDVNQLHAVTFVAAVFSIVFVDLSSDLRFFLVYISRESFELQEALSPRSRSGFYTGRQRSRSSCDNNQGARDVLLLACMFENRNA